MLAEASDTPSQLLTAFIRYLRARPTDSEHESAASDEGSPVLEGVTRVFHELGSVPTIMLERTLLADPTAPSFISTAAATSVAPRRTAISR